MEVEAEGKVNMFWKNQLFCPKVMMSTTMLCIENEGKKILQTNKKRLDIFKTQLNCVVNPMCSIKDVQCINKAGF